MDTGIIYKIWNGGQDNGVDIDFLLAPRPFNSGGKFGQSRIQFFLVRSQTFGSSFDLYYNIDNVDSGVFQGLTATQFITLLDQNIYEKLPAPTLSLTNINPSITAGNYYYKYRLWQNVAPYMTTEASDPSLVVTVAADPNDGVAVLLPKCDVAMTKGYTRYLVYRTDVGTAQTSTYYWRATVNMSVGFDVTWNDSAVSVEPLACPEPDAELLWGTAEVKQIRVPDYGKLHAGAKGEYARLTITGSTSDLNLRLMALGISMKPKAIR